MVRSHLEYANSVWHPRRISDIEKLEKVQKRATMNDNDAHFGYVNYIFYQSTSQDRNADEINSADYEKK